VSAPGPGPGAEQNFEIPLRRPYAPLVLLIVLMLPLGLACLIIAPKRGHEDVPILVRACGVASLAASAFFCLVLFTLARHARFALVATMDTLTLPRSRMPVLSTEPQVIAWRDLRVVSTNDGGDLVLQTKTRRRVLPAYWFRGPDRAKAAAQALDERMRLAHQRIGAKL
jgi:hypothetical protein